MYSTYLVLYLYKNRVITHVVNNICIYIYIFDKAKRSVKKKSRRSKNKNKNKNNKNNTKLIIMIIIYKLYTTPKHITHTHKPPHLTIDFYIFIFEI